MNISRRQFVKKTVGGLVYLAVPALFIPNEAETANILSKEYLFSLKKEERREILKEEREKLYGLPEDELFARMLFGEARDTSRAERITVGFTPRNRVGNKKFPHAKDLRRALTQPHQYSCFKFHDKDHLINFLRIISPTKYEPEEKWQACLEDARNILEGEHDKADFGATNYHRKGQVPYWAGDMSEKLPSSPHYVHEFYIA